MKCPYCNIDMTLGYIQSSRPIVWDEEKLRGCILPDEEKGMMLTKGIFKPNAIETYFCKACNILLSKVPEE